MTPLSSAWYTTRIPSIRPLGTFFFNADIAFAKTQPYAKLGFHAVGEYISTKEKKEQKARLCWPCGYNEHTWQHHEEAHVALFIEHFVFHRVNVERCFSLYPHR